MHWKFSYPCLCTSFRSGSEFRNDFHCRSSRRKWTGRTDQSEHRKTTYEPDYGTVPCLVDRRSLLNCNALATITVQLLPGQFYLTCSGWFVLFELIKCRQIRWWCEKSTPTTTTPASSEALCFICKPVAVATTSVIHEWLACTSLEIEVIAVSSLTIALLVATAVALVQPH